ncbi:MAG: hypothetical protein HY303_06660 [Candidatus Wallbacteria bacterium]|nr:hypothetical protein [Candidatus Wallbacteria bacterium]
MAALQPTKENPLSRLLAATGNNLAATLEERPTRTAEEDELMHAKECLAICEKSSADAGELFFAHEALAKAHLIARELDVAKVAFERMTDLLPRIEDPEFRSFCEAELGKLSQTLKGP